MGFGPGPIIEPSFNYSKHNTDIRSRSSEGISEIARFNCFAYAFGVWDEPTYRQFVDERQSSSLINSDFVSEMLKHGDLAELSEEQVRPRSLALYFADDVLRHAGIAGAASTPRSERQNYIADISYPPDRCSRTDTKVW